MCESDHLSISVKMMIRGILIRKFDTDPLAQVPEDDPPDEAHSVAVRQVPFRNAAIFLKKEEKKTFFEVESLNLQKCVLDDR